MKDNGLLNKLCDHPKEHEQEIGLAVFCLLCKARLRFLSDEVSNAKITRALEDDIHRGMGYLTNC
jgi:hypothetical protein